MSKDLKEVREDATHECKEGTFKVSLKLEVFFFYNCGFGWLEALLLGEGRGQEVKEHCERG